ATGGSYTFTPPAPSVASVGTTNYYVSQYFQYTPTIGCESPRAAVVATVNPLPTANLTGDATVCQDATSPLVAFEGSGGLLPYTFRYTLNGATQPTVTQTGASPFTVPVATGLGGLIKYELIEVSDGYGCVRSMSKTVTVTVLPSPDANLTGPADGCAASNKSLTFTGSLGTAPYTFSYSIDGISQPTVTGSTVTVPMSTAQPGTQTYTLQKVSYTVGGKTCEKAFSRDHVFKVLPSPILDASILNHPGKTLSLCQNSPSPTVRLGITDGQAPYTIAFRYRGSLQTVPVPAGQMELTFPVATATPGIHDFELVEIRDAKGCNRTYTNDKATVTILATPDAAISGTTQLCMYGGTAPVSFTGSGGKAPYSFTYTLNGGAPQTVSSPAGAANATLQTPSDVAGSFEYRLVRVSYDDGITCSKDLTGSATVTINPSPVLPTVTAATFCLGTAGATLPTVTPVAGTILRWYGTSATGGTWAATAPVPPTGTAGLLRYYVSQFNPTTGCEGQRAEIPVRIHPLPEAVLGPGAIVCQSSPDPQLTLTGSKGTSPYTFSYRINGGPTLNAVTTAGASATSLSISTVGALNASYELLEVLDANGCRQAQSGTSVFRVLATPDATITAPAEVCRTAIASTTFTATSGKAPFTFTYTINGGAEQTVVSPNGVNTAKVDIPDAVIGVQTFRLTKVSYSDGTTCVKDLSQDVSITVNPLPLGSIGIVSQTTNTILLCQGSASPGIQFTGSEGAEPYTFSYTLNGAQQTTRSVSGPSITQPASTLTGGTFVYELGKVTDARGCVSNLTGLSATVRILNNPGGAINGAVKVCEKDIDPTLTFKGSMGRAPYRFTYSLNGGPDIVMLTPTGSDSTTLRSPTAVPGTFTYRLKEVSYTDGITCTSRTSNEAIVTVHDLPFASMSGSSPDIEICQLQPSPEILFSGKGGMPPYTFRYRRNNDVISSTGNPFIEKATTRTAGTTLYELLEVQDARLCRQAQPGTVKVTVHPTPVVDAGPDKIMLENTGITLDGSAYNGNGLRFQWTPSSSLNDPTILKPLATPVQLTRYLLTVTSDKGCMDTSSMLLTVLFKPVIPNTFTPNGDGYNDRWEILNLGAYPDAIVEIYNDRGHLLMRSTGQYRPWDGTYKGMPLPVGTYYYVIHPRSGRDKVAGYLTILR
ncbi:MAG: gliding motility-associated C-terminal domain-containing protein, partial [Chitinophagia bacterium]|nr:gliding motility-associated C-terminal domain-containing protein [Chitinophagia bacterium]